MRPPRRACLDTLLAYDGNNLKATETLRKYRNGFYFAWNVPLARAHLRKCGFKAPGEYNINNQQGGCCFSLPREVPGASRFTNNDAGWAMRHCLKQGRATLSQAQSVKKMLSYVYQLQKAESGNFSKVQKVYDRHGAANFAPGLTAVGRSHACGLTPDSAIGFMPLDEAIVRGVERGKSTEVRTHT